MEQGAVCNHDACETVGGAQMIVQGWWLKHRFDTVLANCCRFKANSGESDSYRKQLPPRSFHSPLSIKRASPSVTTNNADVDAVYQLEIQAAPLPAIPFKICIEKSSLIFRHVFQILAVNGQKLRKISPFCVLVNIKFSFIFKTF